jgi:5-methylcytosine-specific restriction endonuclease McrA
MKRGPYTHCAFCGKPLKKMMDARRLQRVGFCIDHVPDNLRCSAITEKGTRCKHLISNNGLCDSHIKTDGNPGKKQQYKSLVEWLIEKGEITGIYQPVNYYEYIVSDEWRTKAIEAKKRAGWKCQVCNKPGTALTLKAHHRTYERLGHENPEDITVLCSGCHEKFHDILPEN